MGFAGLIVAVNAVPAAATRGHDFVGTVLGRGTYVGHGSLPLKQGLDIVVTKNTVEVGGSSGWHSHPGGAIVVVQLGEITTYRSAGKGEGEAEDGDAARSHCIINKYTHGQAFIERPGEPLNAVNTGSIQTIIYATFPGVPKGVVGAQRTDEPNPGTCPGV